MQTCKEERRSGSKSESPWSCSSLNLLFASMTLSNSQPCKSIQSLKLQYSFQEIKESPEESVLLF